MIKILLFLLVLFITIELLFSILKTLRYIIDKNDLWPWIIYGNYVREKRTSNSPHRVELIRWFKDRGDKTLRLNYTLSPDSIIFDLGGYKGDWARPMGEKYNCTIHVFEPVKKYANNLTKIFKNNPKVVVHDFGLGANDNEFEIAISGEASSTFKKGTRTQKIKILDATNFMKNNNIKMIDVMKINIEGGEYALLDNLINSGFIGHINNIQIQFHDFATDAAKQMEKIQHELSKTHTLTWQYRFVWENWKIKSE